MRNYSIQPGHDLRGDPLPESLQSQLQDFENEEVIPDEPFYP